MREKTNPHIIKPTIQSGHFRLELAGHKDLVDQRLVSAGVGYYSFVGNLSCQYSIHELIAAIIRLRFEERPSLFRATFSST
jgi:hypothetical protein